MKILVIRLSSIGDVVLAAPVMHALKQWAGADIHLLSKPKMGDLLKNGRAVDQFYIWGEKDLWKRLKSENYDAILDLHCNLRSHWVRLQLLGVPVFEYDKKRLQRALFVKFKNNKYAVSHVSERYMQAAFDLLDKMCAMGSIKQDKVAIVREKWDAGEMLAGLLSHKIEKIAGENGEAEVSINTHSVLYINEIEKKLGLKWGVAIVGGTYFTKKIPLTLWQLILDADTSLRWVAIGGVEDASLAEELTRLYPGRFLNFCGKLTLQESAELIESASWAIGGDTGFSHVAAALQKPLLLVWGNTHPGLGFAAGVRVNPNKTLHLLPKNLSCHPCTKLGFDACPAVNFDCMNAHSAQEVKLLLQNLQGIALQGC